MVNVSEIQKKVWWFDFSSGGKSLHQQTSKNVFGVVAFKQSGEKKTFLAVKFTVLSFSLSEQVKKVLKTEEISALKQPRDIFCTAM